MATYPWNPDNDVGDGMYIQIREKAALVKAINARITVMALEFTTLKEQRDVLLVELVALRDGITREITGVALPSEIIQMPPVPGIDT